MTIVPLEIGTQSNPGRFGQDGDAHIINGYAEEIGKEGKHPIPVYVCAGLYLFATLTDGGVVRCMLALDASLYVVAGRAIYRVDASSTWTNIGGLPSDGIVTMASNRAGQILVVCDGITKLIEGGTVTDVATPVPFNSVCFLGGYFLCSSTNGQFYWSGIDTATFAALDFASAEANSDKLLINKPMGQYDVLFGVTTTEFHALTTDADAPFQRSSVISVGCFAAGSVCEVPIITGTNVTDSIAWAAADRQGSYAGICLLDNQTARKISTHSVDRAVRDEPDPLSITSCSWSDGGHAFYNISGSSFSWTFDTASGQWHERRSYGLNRWKVRSVQNFGGQLIAGDYTSNKLYRMSNDLFTEGDDPLIMTIQTPPVHAFPERLEFNALHMDLIPGVGLASGAAEDIEPEVMVSWARDGINFGAIHRVKIGRLGQTVKSIKTNRLGQSRRGEAWTFRFSISAAVAKGMMGAALDVSKIAA